MAMRTVIGSPSPVVADRRPDGTSGASLPLSCLHNYTGGEWSRLRSWNQGKRAEEGNDELVNHALQTTQAPTRVSARTPSLPDRSVGVAVRPGSSSARILASTR